MENQEAINVNNLAQRALLVSVHIRLWTARKLDKKVTQEIAKERGVDPRVGAYHKALIDGEELRGVNQAARAIRDRVLALTLPWDDRGTRLLATTGYMNFVRDMRPLAEALAVQRDSFLDKYPELRESARQHLGSMFNDEDYPPEEQVRGKFAFTMSFTPIPNAEDFRCQLDDRVVDSMRKRLTTQTQRSFNEAMQEGMQNAQEILHRYIKNLSNKPNVRNTMVDRINEIVSILDGFNIYGDERMADMVARMRDEIAVYSVDDLRKKAGAKEKALAAAERIATDFEDLFKN